MFKFGYQAFIMLSIMSSYMIMKMIVGIKNHESGIRNIKMKSWGRALFIVLLVPQLFLVSIYPYFSVNSYFGNLKDYQGLYGFKWLDSEYTDDSKAIAWLRTYGERPGESLSLFPNDQIPVIVEADGDSYTDYARVSAFTGYPTVIGWAVHEWLWRGTYDIVAPRREEVKTIYESENVTDVRNILKKYEVTYVVVGSIERQKYPKLSEAKFSLLGKEVFHSGGTAVYEVK